MFPIRRCELPAAALHGKYRVNGDYVDCYGTVIRGAVSHTQFVEAFYTTWLFKIERLILRLLVAKPSTDEDVYKLAMGQSNSFAAWSVEGRADNQLLLCDFLGSTRSWLMVASEDRGGGVFTRLYFGSVVVGRIDSATGERRLGLSFRLLLPFHKIYSRALLAVAKTRITHRLSNDRS